MSSALARRLGIPRATTPARPREGAGEVGRRPKGPRESGVEQEVSSSSPYFTVAQAAAHLQASEAKVRKLLTKKKLSRCKLGTRTLTLRSEVEALALVSTIGEQIITGLEQVEKDALARIQSRAEQIIARMETVQKSLSEDMRTIEQAAQQTSAAIARLDSTRRIAAEMAGKGAIN